jgi:hypothetical protein
LNNNPIVSNSTQPKGDFNDKERHGHRLELSCRIFFFGDNDFEGEGRVLDISTYGCRMATDENLPIDMLLKVSIFLSDHPWPLRINQAIVRWVNEGQIGLEFTSIRLAQRERLRAVLMKRSDNKASER